METNNQNNETDSLEYSEEDELFDYIDILDIGNIKKMLSAKVLPIWDYKSKGNLNSTVLNISVYKKSLNITQLFIDYCKEKNPEKLKEFINASNDQGVAPLHYASFRGEIQIIKLLMDNGADMTKKTKRNLNVIHYCAQGNKPNALMYFYLKLRENTNSSDQYDLIKEKDGGGSTSLHWAVYSLAEDLLLYLINLDIFESDKERNDFLNQLDNQGFSALHLCVSSKTPRIAIKLLQNGADPSVVDKNGNTPLQLAISKKEEETIQIFRNVESCQFCNFKAPVKQLKKSPKNIIYVFTSQIIACIILFLSVFPIFLFYYNNLFGKIFFIIYAFLLILFFLIYFTLLIIDPGLKEKKDLNFLKELIDGNRDLTKFCYKCFIKKTSTSKHCIICDRCYDDFDHHCFWINKCVAKRNYKLFMTFLFVAAIYLIFTLAITIISLIEMIKNFWNINICHNNIYFKLENMCKIIFENKFIIHFILNICLISMVLFFLIPEFLLLFLHLHVYFTNYKEEKSMRNTSSFSNDTSLMNDDSSILIPNNA